MEYADKCEFCVLNGNCLFQNNVDVESCEGDE